VTNTTVAAKSLKVAEKETGQTVVEVLRCLVRGASLDVMARRAEADAVSVTGGGFARSITLADGAKGN
jgi:hypothetical protein